MGTRVTLRRVTEVPASARVCHYDELTETTKERFPEWVDEESQSVCVDLDAVDGLRECDLVKYTDYYRITPA